MTDDIHAAFAAEDDSEPLTPDELLEQQARELADVPPVLIPDAADLPDDVRDGHVEDDPNVQEQPITEPKEV